MEKEKRFDPSPNRLRKAIQSGSLPISRQAVPALQITIGLPFSFYLLQRLLPELAELSKTFVTAKDFDTKIMLLSSANGLSQVVGFCLRTGCLIAACGVFAAIAVRGFAPIFNAPRLSWRLFDPRSGLRQLFGIEPGQTAASSVIVSAGRRILQAVCVAGLLFAGGFTAARLFLRIFGDEFGDGFVRANVYGNQIIGGVAAAADKAGAEQVLQFSQLLLIVCRLLLPILTVCLFAGLADALIARRQWRRGLMMNETELKDELREQEGDPILASVRRQLQREIALHDVIENVRNSDVVVVTAVDPA